MQSFFALNGTGTIAGNYEDVRATKEPYTDKKKAAAPIICTDLCMASTIS